MKKLAKNCEGCREKVMARFRTMLDLFLCDHCYAAWRATGEVPKPTLQEDQPWTVVHS